MRIGKLFFWGAVFLGLAYYALRSPLSVADPRFIKEDFPGPGAPISVSVFLDTGFPRQRAHQAIADVVARLRASEAAAAPFGEGTLGALNLSLSRGAIVTVPKDLAELFDRAEQARKDTGGLCDARLGALQKLWGFADRTTSQATPPAATEIQKLTASIQRAAGYRGGDYGPSLAVQWDFDALPRALALDSAAATLKAAGISNAMISFGGTLVTRGKRGSAPWRIGIRNARARGPNDVLGYLLDDRNEAITTRGDDENFFEAAGRRYHDILDPRIGAPAMGLRTVTVVAIDGGDAALAAQALFVAGPDGWRELARKLGVQQAMVVDASGQISVTKTLNERLKLLHDATPFVLP